MDKQIQLDNELLEDMVDRHTLKGVLNYLSVICDEKAEHIRTNWRDGTTSAEYDAKPWEQAASYLNKAAERFTNL